MTVRRWDKGKLGPAEPVTDHAEVAMLFFQQLVEAGVAVHCEREYVFVPPHKWTLDFAWPDLGYAMVLEDGWKPSWDTQRDIYNLAVLHGWKILRATSGMVLDGRAIGLVRAAFNRKSGEQAVGTG